MHEHMYMMFPGRGDDEEPGETSAQEAAEVAAGQS